MKINLVSDLHINVRDIELPGGDILIIAGDCMEAGHLRRAEHAGKDTFLADRYRRFASEEMTKYRHVVYVKGNHEHYHNTFETTHDWISKILPSNVHFLENTHVNIDGVYFWGATMWTDMHNGCPITVEAVQNGLNDFKLIRYEHNRQIQNYWTNKFTARCAMREQRNSVHHMLEFLNTHREDTVVIINHHAPSRLSVNPAHAGDYYLNGGYHNHFEDLILDNPQIKLFVHGHMHDPVRYYLGDTLVACNPRGYYGWEPGALNFVQREIDLDNLPDREEVDQDRQWINP
jgi:Icc-related predicted phosphoesterase